MSFADFEVDMFLSTKSGARMVFMHTWGFLTMLTADNDSENAMTLSGHSLPAS